MVEITSILETAQKIIAANPEPVVKYRLLRDVLCVDSENDELKQVKTQIANNKWVQQLQEEQWDDGSWGRFHTQDTQLKQKITTTEVGISRSIHLGLDLEHAIVRKARDYCVQILTNQVKIRDQVERSWGIAWWNTGIQKIVAASLAQIQPDHPVLDPIRQFWLNILIKSFPNGVYDRNSEIKAHLKARHIDQARLSKYALTSIKKNRALQMFDKYSVYLLGTDVSLIPPICEKSYFKELWERGIGYLEVPPKTSPTIHVDNKSKFGTWLTSLELLSFFPTWNTYVKNHMEWIWNQRNKEGFWDFGAVSPINRTALPLSSSWRKKNARIFDWTTRILIILRKYSFLQKKRD